MENQRADSADLSTSQFVPLISYLSPTLSRLSLLAPHQASRDRDVSSLLQRLFTTAVSFSSTSNRFMQTEAFLSPLSISPCGWIMIRSWTYSRWGWAMILSRTRGLRGCGKELWTSYCVKNCVLTYSLLQWVGIFRFYNEFTVYKKLEENEDLKLKVRRRRLKVPQ